MRLSGLSLFAADTDAVLLGGCARAAAAEGASTHVHSCQHNHIVHGDECCQASVFGRAACFGTSKGRRRRQAAMRPLPWRQQDDPRGSPRLHRNDLTSL
jgi:hypothetical protein